MEAGEPDSLKLVRALLDEYLTVKRLDRLASIVCSRVGSLEDAQDCVSEVAISVLSKHDLYDGRPFEGWFIGFLNNRVRTYARGVRRRMEVSLDCSLEGWEPIADYEEDIPIDSDIRTALSMISEEDGELLMHAFVDRESQKTMAEESRIPHAIMRRRVTNAKNRLRAAVHLLEIEAHDLGVL